jgi:hypothetical protein
MSGHTVREVVFDLFRSFGMTTIFGNPGSTELPMFRDFPADFRYVLGLQEMWRCSAGAASGARRYGPSHRPGSTRRSVRAAAASRCNKRVRSPPGHPRPAPAHSSI